MVLDKVKLVTLLNLIVPGNAKNLKFSKKYKQNLLLQSLNLIKNKLKISKFKILNESILLIKSDKSVNGKLVNELNRLPLVQICRKTVGSLILTTTQMITPIGYPIRVPSFFKLLSTNYTFIRFIR